MTSWYMKHYYSFSDVDWYIKTHLKKISRTTTKYNAIRQVFICKKTHHQWKIIFERKPMLTRREGGDNKHIIFSATGNLIITEKTTFCHQFELYYFLIHYLKSLNGTMSSWLIIGCIIHLSTKLMPIIIISTVIILLSSRV